MLRAGLVAVALAALNAVGAVATASTGETTAPPLAERVRACTLCHGDEGRAGPDGYYPRLAGKPAGYLYQQLRHFAEGRRNHEPMRRLLSTLDDTTLRQFAEHFSAIELPYPVPAAPRASVDRLARGRLLALQGDTASGLPACASCHGDRLTGVEPDVPGLLGLPLDYLNAQLGAWRTGLRKAHAPDCMAKIARQLGTQDLTAVTYWLASQSVPDGGRPEAASARQRDNALACGVDASAATPPIMPPSARPQSAGPASTASATDPVARGAYLARAGNCVACHTVRGAPMMSGGRPIQTPFGAVFSSNLTPDADTGLGRWTADDFWNALHHGRSRDGRLLAPAFPYEHTTRIRRDDSDALFAWLRSLPAVHAPQPAHQLTWPFGTQPALAVWRALFFKPASFVADPTRTELWNRGAYLVEALGHCAACHAPRNALGAIKSVSDVSGARMPVVGWYAPSLVDDRQTGLASIPIEQSMRLLKTGAASHASASGPMAEVIQHGLQYLSDDDLRAIATYLRERTSAAKEPAKPGTPSPSLSASHPGAPLYRRHCADCHGETGEGRSGLYPPLRGNRAVLLDEPGNVVLSVLHGGYTPVTEGNPAPAGMPPFLLELDNTALAAVITWIRAGLQAPGRGAPAVTASDVSRIRDRSRW